MPLNSRWAAVLAGLASLAALTGGAAADPTAGAKVSVFDAPPLARARYVSQFRMPYGEPLQVLLERGVMKCAPLVTTLEGRYPEAAELARGEKTCDLGLAMWLVHQMRAGADVQTTVVGADGKKYLFPSEIVDAAKPIDTPAKALLVLWLDYKTPQVTWSDGHGGLTGGPEDGHVRALPDGFEVEVTSDDTSMTCDKKHATYTHVLAQRFVRVDAEGEIHELRKVPLHTEVLPCHR